jgi:hypothetical protein
MTSLFCSKKREEKEAMTTCRHFIRLLLNLVINICAREKNTRVQIVMTHNVSVDENHHSSGITKATTAACLDDLSIQDLDAPMLRRFDGHGTPTYPRQYKRGLSFAGCEVFLETSSFDVIAKNSF